MSILNLSLAGINGKIVSYFLGDNLVDAKVGDYIMINPMGELVNTGPRGGSYIVKGDGNLQKTY